MKCSPHKKLIPSLIGIPNICTSSILPAAKVGWYVAADVGLEHSFDVSVTKGDAKLTRLL